MRLGVFARTYASTDPASLLGLVSSDGYASVQLNLSCFGLKTTPEIVAEVLIEKIAAAVYHTGVSIAAMSGTYNMVDPDPTRKESGRRGLSTVMRVARRLGVPVVTLCTGSKDPDDMWRHHRDNTGRTVWDELGHEMESVLDEAEQLGLLIGVEPDPGNIISNAVLGERLLGQMRCKCLGIVLDPGNLLTAETVRRQHDLLADAVDRLGSALVLCHAKDIASDGTVVSVGSGVVDFADFLGLIRGTGYEGDWIVHGVAAQDAARAAHRLRRLIATR